MIHQLNMYGKDKVEVAIERFRAFEPPEGYYLAFSGGKDSCVIKALADMSGVKYDAHYNVTSVDPPELIYFIRGHHADVIFDYPRDKDGNRITMWNLIAKKGMPPTRIVRYCCAELKESQGRGRFVVTGVRRAESAKRSTRNGIEFSNNKTGKMESFDVDNADEVMVHACHQKRRKILNPIIDWTDSDVWEFIRENNIPYCQLYDEGYKRLGCIGCPMGTVEHRKKEFEKYPKYRDAYLRAFEKMVETNRLRGGRSAMNSGTITKNIFPSGHAQKMDFSNMKSIQIMEWWLQ